MDGIKHLRISTKGCSKARMTFVKINAADSISESGCQSVNQYRNDNMQQADENMFDPEKMRNLPNPSMTNTSRPKIFFEAASAYTKIKNKDIFDNIKYSKHYL
uniref:Uncharacterized protein n=1 Tax=Romanomermis culicivorax TaxID=13658 RepID=A0A915JUM8_ROMCU